MKTRTKIPGRRPGMVLALAAAGLAATAAMAWGGITAAATVSTVNAGIPAGQTPPSIRPGQAVAGADPAPTATKETPGASPALKLGPIPAFPPGPKGSSGTGNSSEVSLAQAGSAEAGHAAGSRPDGNDRSADLSKRGTVDPADVLANGNLSLGGCLPEYGAAGQCLPAVPPSLSRHLQEMKDAGLDPASMPHNWTCGEVRSYFKNGLPLRKATVDPQNLDANKDGVACGPAD